MLSIESRAAALEAAANRTDATMTDRRTEPPPGAVRTAGEAPCIRCAVPGDAATIVRFQLAMARETEDLELDPAVVKAGVEALFAEPSKGAYWVAETPGQGLVGCLLTVPEWSDWRNGEVLWIHSVYVVPAARGRGVYRRLYSHLVATVRADPGLRGLRLYVDKRNTSAQRAYERLGMQRDHYHLYEWLEDG